MKKILITGANGFIGSSLVDYLKQRDFEVTCLIRAKSDTSLLPENAEIQRIDYNDDKALSQAIAKHEIIIHTAALTKARNWQQIYRANVELTQKLVDSFNAATNAEQFIFLSSQAAAGPAKEKHFPKQESDENEPITIYGKSKLEAEKYIIENCRNYTIIRPVSVFGPGDKDFLSYFKMVEFHLSIKLGRAEKLFNLIYIDDLLEIIFRSIDNPKVYDQIFFAANERAISQTEFTRLFSQALQKKLIQIPVPFCILKIIALFSRLFCHNKTALINSEKIKEFKQQFWLVDTAKMEKLLAWKPAENFLKQIADTYNWYKEKGWL